MLFFFLKNIFYVFFIGRDYFTGKLIILVSFIDTKIAAKCLI